MKIRHTAATQAELTEILSYIANENPPAADRVATAIDRTFDWIEKRPLT